MTITWNTPVTAPSTWANIGYGVSTYHTFTGLNGGTSYPAGAYAVVWLGNSRGDVTPFSGVTIGGVTAALIVSDDPANASYNISAWGASLPSGGVDNVVVTSSNVIGSGGYWS